MKVYLLFANESEYTSLRPVSESDWDILNWFNGGFSLADRWRPITVEEDREGSEEPLPLSDFPSLSPSVPVFSQRAVEALEECLVQNGELLPLSFPGGQYYAFNCMNTVDCLDYERSAIIRVPGSGRIFQIERYVFLADRLVGTEIFRIPENSGPVFVTDAFARRVFQNGLTGFELLERWDSRDS